MHHKLQSNNGFTLIELSIVLVVIGLIVGGVLVGRDLISAAAVRGQISQIEKYQQATNTFRGKYGYLPGDIRATEATQFGFQPRGIYAGTGDGNGIIEGIQSDIPYDNSGGHENAGETVMFWRDLSDAKLIDGSFTTASSSLSTNYQILPNSATPSHKISAYLPQAKIGNGNYIYVWSGGAGNVTGSGYFIDGANYMGISIVRVIYDSITSDQGMTVAQAVSIDKKMDDGLPQSGTVQAWYLDYAKTPFYVAWSTGTGGMGDYDGDTGAPITAQTNNPEWDNNSDLSKLCYYNGQNKNALEQYNTAYPTQINCGLSIKLQ